MNDQKMKEFTLSTNVFNALPEESKKQICEEVGNNLHAIVVKIADISKYIKFELSSEE